LLCLLGPEGGARVLRQNPGQRLDTRGDELFGKPSAGSGESDITQRGADMDTAQLNEYKRMAMIGGTFWKR
jgi:hypothetical protein